MIETVPAPPGVVAFVLTGKVVADDYDVATAAIDAHLETHERVRVLIDASGLDGMSAGALKEDVTYGLSRIGDLSRFERVAVITDSDALEALVRGAGAVVPGMETRVFEPGERDPVLAWLMRSAGTVEG